MATAAIKGYYKGVAIDKSPETFFTINPNSIDVTLGASVLRIDPTVEVIDVLDNNSLRWYEDIIRDEGMIMLPDEFMLATVNERFSCGNKIAQMYEGRSTIARIGLFTHICAGFGDIGFNGNFTLELKNVSNKPIKLYPDIRIGQIAFIETNSTLYNEELYLGAYRHQYNRPLPPVLGEDRMFQ